ncbi:cell division protein FtsQ/DivIB [Candidatus Merdisoma sp. HCP28S3_D10]|uniref:cell division protein FtsQ/DivIB n=1 Tax=unclassified Candidatus Merdisoma TaxID=3099611 RepID=UPI003F8A6A0E
MEKFQERKQIKKRKRRGKGFLAALVIFLLLALAAVGLISLFKIRKVEITGNSFYSEQEIRDRIITDRYSQNSLYLYLKYKYFNKEEIPFIDKIEVSLKGPGSVKIRVYEKSVIGYVTYMGSHFYFDKDGVVVESSADVKEGIPCISGVKFSSLALYQKLQVEDDKIFSRILNITQLLKKYELSPDKIEFGRDLSLTLYFADVKVALGSGDNLEDKVGRLHELYSDLEGLSGTLRMENYTSDSKFISFEKDSSGE